jgi:SPP1 family predicted phage head-tail adaptor
VRAGNLRHYVIIQSVTATADGMGGTTEVWGTHTSVYAGIWPKKSDEQVIDGKLVLVNRTMFRIRYLSTLTSDMRILYGTRVFEIIDIRNADERGIYQDLMCREIA